MNPGKPALYTVQSVNFHKRREYNWFDKGFTAEFCNLCFMASMIPDTPEAWLADCEGSQNIILCIYV